MSRFYVIMSTFINYSESEGKVILLQKTVFCATYIYQFHFIGAGLYLYLYC